MWSARFLISVYVPYLLACEVSSHPDEIQELPGLNETLTFRQYAGYLNASEGKFLHYWFVESQRSPSKDPVMLWMNGGPGCSSLDGLLTELGPFYVNSDGRTLYINPYSWNKVANVIFLESPAGVGYSYSNSEDYEFDDDTVSEDNYLALQHFFKKFPKFQKNDFYISGESYAGIYIPTLSVRILRGTANINFKGFLIGNGLLDERRLSDSLLFFAYYHGVVSQSTWDAAVKYCCDGIASRYSCDFSSRNISAQCKKTVNGVLLRLQLSGLNFYNMYADCPVFLTIYISSRDVTCMRTTLKSFSSYREAIGMSPPCIDSRHVAAYLNQESVRKALNVPRFLPGWQPCSLMIDVLYKRTYKTMRPQILELIGSNKLRGLIYNGDVDMVCNFLGDEWFVDDLELPLVKEHKPWYHNNQVAGFSKSFKNLTYTTIKGAGHMVPEDKPEVSLKMVADFLSNKPF